MTDPKSRGRAIGLGLGAAGALYLGAHVPGAVAGLLALALHLAGFVAARQLLLGRVPAARRPLVAFGTGALVILGVLAWPSLLPYPFRTALLYVHVLLGAGVLGAAGLALGRNGHAWRVPVLAAGLAGLLATYALAESRRFNWEPPQYDAQACYRFLTATTAAQSGEPGFPSALRVRAHSTAACLSGGCHADVRPHGAGSGHASAAATRAYQATLADFERRRGSEAAAWCRGCHQPASTGEGVGCQGCHGVRQVHALYGSAALELDLGSGPGLAPFLVPLRPAAHAASTFRPAVQRSAEACGACHRKSYNLPQNDYHWMPGPDEYRGWQTSRFSGHALYAPGPAAPARACVGCHDPHGAHTKAPDYGMRLDLFLRRPAAGPAAVEPLPGRSAPRVGEEVLLDVVLANEGIGHDFPTGMPDLWDTWLEVTVADASGRAALRSASRTSDGSLSAGAHAYRLRALDRTGKPVGHGDLDRMVAVAEWRRIPAGDADLARFRLRVPAGGLGAVRARLLRARRPEFRRWAGEPAAPEAVLAEAAVDSDTPGRWRRYGQALAAVRAYPQAIHALLQAQQAAPQDLETVLALGRVYLDEGDLLAAREQFRRAGTMTHVAAQLDRARAWEGAVLRRTGQPDAAAAILQPLAARHPRDLRLRFELGLTRLAQLRNEDAAREFEAMLAVDPTDVSAHYNLMLCRQRLNQLAAAQREETVYRFLAPDEAPAPAHPASGSQEDRLLHVHVLEAAP